MSQGLHFGRTIEAEQTAELGRRVLLERLEPLDAQQREEHERDDGRAQAVERRADRTVDVARDLDDPAVPDRRQREQHTGAGHALAGAEQRGRIVEQAELGEQPIEPPIGRIAIGRELERLVVVGGVGSGQVWVRSQPEGLGWLDGRRRRSGQFGSAAGPGGSAGSTTGAGGPDRFGSAAGPGIGSSICSGFADGQPNRRSCLRIAFSDTPTATAIWRWLLPCPRRMLTRRSRERSRRDRPAG
ncbi:MAG TPA: hypothetical protein VFT22_00630 [Kofleriaceae bacterium]|nr:hypothetical protein [Kofleriaceae bacterium]